MKLTTGIRKRFRVSNKVKRVAPKDRFRLCISRSAKNISAQIIDDTKNITLLSASSVEKDIKSGSKVNKTELSKIVAENLQRKLKKRKYQKYFLIEGYISTTVE
jgi:large subunit ribosomal protein L18